MRARTPGALAVGILLLTCLPLAQAPPRDPAAADTPTGTARLRGRVLAADSGMPLRRAQVRAVASAIRTTRLTNTDAEGRYEFDHLPAGRYTIAVSKAGYVGLDFGQRRPFEGGRPLDITNGQIADQIDFALPRGSVIAGRITDDAGDPIIGASVQAMRYQYLPGGRRRRQSASQSWLSGMTNDLGEYRLFGLMPGTYLVSAHGQNVGIVSLTQPGAQTGGLGSIDTRDGFIQTYYPGTANVAEAQPVLVNLAEEAQVSFSLALGRMSKISGIVRQSDGGVPAVSRVSLRPNYVTGGEMGGWGNSPIAADGSFSFANVPPGQYLLEVDTRRAAAQMPEYARLSFTVGGNDIAGLVLTTRPGIAISGRVTFTGKTPPANPDSVLRVYPSSANPEDEGRGISLRPGDGEIDESGRFQIRGVTGQILFRVISGPATHILKSVTLNGVDIIDTPYDTSNGDVTSLEIQMGEPGQINGTARNARGEPMRDFRVALFPAHARPGLLTTRFVRTGSADTNGRFQFLQLPAGDYLGVAVESLEQGQEWDPALQQRLLSAARRFAVNEGQMLTIELPYVE